MKKTFLKLAACAMIALAIAACKGGSSNDPKSVAKNFFEAFKTMNIEEAEKYATKDSKMILGMLKGGISKTKISQDSIKAEFTKHKIEYGEPVINGNDATIDITIDGKEKVTFNLKKEEGLWKVAFDKDGLMKTGAEKMRESGASDQEMQEAQKALEQMNSDSLKNALQDSLGGGKQ